MNKTPDRVINLLKFGILNGRWRTADHHKKARGPAPRGERMRNGDRLKSPIKNGNGISFLVNAVARFGPCYSNRTELEMNLVNAAVGTSPMAELTGYGLRCSCAIVPLRPESTSTRNTPNATG